MVSLKLVGLKSYNFIEKYIFVLAPILALIIFLVLASMNNIAPIGSNTVAWCDLNQQGIPLLNQFKDILEGKQSLFGNLSAGGMSYFGVFFFYIASPFSFLVISVDKAYMQSFVNIIIMLKMATAAFTFSLYLKKKYPPLDGIINLAFSIFYSFSGYVMMYYQTLTWLDMIYLFPILLLGVDLLIDKEKIIPYIISITLIVCINYYIGIMCVFYVILYFGFKMFYYRKEMNVKELSFKFLISSFISVLLSMVILIPSFIDYSQSSRTISIFESLMNSNFLTPYETAIPLILGTIILIPFVFNKKKKEEKLIKLILLALMSIPIIVDPINKMWHYGSYQAFPCRFAFINIFLLLDIISMLLYEDKNGEINKKNIINFSVGLFISLIIIIFSFIFENIYTTNNMNVLEYYTHSLWGKWESLSALLIYYSVILFGVIIIFILYKIKFIPIKGLGLILLSLAIVESAFSFKVYMVSASRDTISYERYYEICNLIKDDSYYNVKTSTKIKNVNDLGGAGYNNFGHYTSLTPKSYMDALKKMGYSSYWMEVGAYGGTILNDAILLNKYTLSSGSSIYANYSTDYYNIKENQVFPLGIVTNNDLTKYSTLEDNTRGLMQQSISEALFNKKEMIKIYNYNSISNLNDLSTDNTFVFNRIDYNENGYIIYEINVTNKTKLYFEAIDRYSNSLYQGINAAINVYANSNMKANKYPGQSYNGFVDLGTFENQNVTIKIELNRSITADSFSVFGIDMNEYDTLISSNVNHADLKYVNNHFEGTYEATEDSYMFLPIAYTKDVRAKVNNKNVEVLKVFDGFVGIKLEKGMNNINISYSKSGLIPGMFIFVLGIGLLISYFVLQDRKQLNILFENDRIKSISYYLVIIGTILLFIILYIFPLLMNLIGFIIK